MPHKKAKPVSAAKAEHLLTTALRRRALAAIPVPPASSLLAKWKSKTSDAGPVTAFPLSEALPMAARSGETISPGSRAKVSALVHEMKREGKPDAK